MSLSARMRVDPIDLRLLDYVSDVDRNLLCPICHCPFIEPLRLPCDHSFCRHCLSRTFQAQSQETKSCPTCRLPANETEILPVPRFLIHLIDDLSIRCPKYAEGCETQLRRGDVQNHVDHYCEFTDVPCSDETCHSRVPRRQMAIECAHATASCRKCKIQIATGELQVCIIEFLVWYEAK